MNDKNMSTNLKYNTRLSMLMFFLKGAVALFAAGIICSVAVAFLDMIGPKIIQYTIDYLLSDNTSKMPLYMDIIISLSGGKEYLMTHLFVIAIVVMVIAALSGLFRYLNKLFNSMASETLIKRMRDSLFDHILKLPFSWHGQNHTGDIIQRCTSDVENIKVFLSEQLTSLFRILVMILFGIYFMFQIDKRLTAISSAFIPVIVMYSFFFFDKIGSSFLKVDEEEGRLSAIAQENLTGVRVVRAFGREVYEKERFEKQNKFYTRMWIDLMRLLAAFWTSNDFIASIQQLFVVVFGSVFCVRGDITVGEFIAFISYNSMISWPVRMLGRVISEMSKAGVSVDRLMEIMNSEPEQDIEGACKPDLMKDISFNNVSFSYNDDAKMTLQNVSFDIKAGSTLGVLGGTGSGKSTLMFLLDRLYDISDDNGSIKIGDVDIRNIDRHYLRENIGLVLQEPFLFSRTIYENIGITKPGAELMDIKRAAKMALLDETIDSFDLGYNTYVGERGVTLSGGQKQRTAIAQMLVSAPPIMIFDDSLSAVDTQTDAGIRNELSKNPNKSTTILISHRITTLMHADNIIVLSHGKIIENGTHKQLIEKGGVYKRIYDIQIQKGSEDFE